MDIIPSQTFTNHCQWIHIFSPSHAFLLYMWLLLILRPVAPDCPWAPFGGSPWDSLPPEQGFWPLGNFSARVMGLWSSGTFGDSCYGVLYLLLSQPSGRGQDRLHHPSWPNPTCLKLKCFQSLPTAQLSFRPPSRRVNLVGHIFLQTLQ